MSFTAKSVIVDVADSYLGTYVGIRSIDFYFEGSKLTKLEADFTCYASGQVSASYAPKYTFDTSKSKIGAFTLTQWLVGVGIIEKRAICVFDSEITFDEIRINNGHSNGGSTNIGAKNVVIHVSDDTITDTDYGAAISNSTKVFDGVFDEHAATNTEDEETLLLLSDQPVPAHSFAFLLHSDTTDGSTAFVDSGVYSHTITAVGDAEHSTTYSKFGGSSIFFDGSGDYLALGDSASWFLDEEDFTIDLWVYPLAFSARQVLMAQYNSGATVLGFWLEINASGNLVFGGTSPTVLKTSTGTLTANTWQHVAVVRSGNTLKMYINGTADATTWDVTGLSFIDIGYPLIIGTYSTSFPFNGYMDEIRLLKGTAAWLTDFTPPTAAYTIDSSLNYFTAKSVIFDIAADWGSASYTYMGVRAVDFWFEGAKIALDPSTDFVAYATSEFAATYPVESIFDTSLSKTGGFAGNEWLSAASVTTQRFNVVFTTEQTFDQIRVNNNHHAGTRTDTGIRSTVITISDDSITSTTYASAIANSTQIFDDDISQHVPTDTEDEETLLLLGDPLPSTTVLLIHSDNVGNESTFVDSSDSGHAITRSSVPVNTEDEQKIGETSIYFDGIDDLIYMADSVDLALLDYDFTFEFWVKCGRLATKEFLCGQLNSAGATTTANLVFEKQADNSIRLHQGYGAGGNYILFTPGLSFPDTNWHHLCLERDGDTLTMYLDGVAGTTTQDVTGYALTDQSTYFSFGRASYYTAYHFQGYMDEIRLVKKEAVYQGAFTPQTTAFEPLQMNLFYKFLLHSDTTDGDTDFVDSSKFGNTITAVGSPDHSTDVAKFGDTAIDVRTVNQSLNVASSDMVAFGNDDFTMDMWVYFTSIASNQYLLDLGTNGGSIIMNGTFKFYNASTGTSGALFLSGPTPVVNTWYHVAVCRYYGTTTAYLDGVAWGSQTDARVYPNAALKLAEYGGSGNYFYGYMDEVRILKGTAAWTANFTPPTEPYTADNVVPTTYEISGVVTENTTPVARTVRAYSKSTGALLDSTTSDGTTGAYSFTFDNGNEVFIIAFDDDAGTVYNAVILDKITPS